MIRIKSTQPPPTPEPTSTTTSSYWDNRCRECFGRGYILRQAYNGQGESTASKRPCPSCVERTKEEKEQKEQTKFERKTNNIRVFI